MTSKSAIGFKNSNNLDLIVNIVISCLSFLTTERTAGFKNTNNLKWLTSGKHFLLVILRNYLAAPQSKDKWQKYHWQYFEATEVKTAAIAASAAVEIVFRFSDTSLAWGGRIINCVQWPSAEEGSHSTKCFTLIWSGIGRSCNWSEILQSLQDLIHRSTLVSFLKTTDGDRFRF